VGFETVVVCFLDQPVVLIRVQLRTST